VVATVVTVLALTACTKSGKIAGNPAENTEWRVGLGSHRDGRRRGSPTGPCQRLLTNLSACSVVPMAWSSADYGPCF
jgi:hypothetical protein